MITIESLLEMLVERNGSDLYLTVGTAPGMRVDGNIERIGEEKLTEEAIRGMIVSIISEEGVIEFDATLEYNTAIDWRGVARMRINLFRQRQHCGMVIRRIRNDIPGLQALGLTKVHSDLVMEKRGLVIVVGPTGSGKSTTLASMLQYRNHHGHGHILTIEDPVEFVHDHYNCIITQRDVGIDTFSFASALKNALRQMPDVIVVGEIRDRETMEQALVFSETGHLCLATIHANNTTQAIERIVNLFPEIKHKQVLLSLSTNLKAVLSQRLIANVHNKQTLAMEIMLNQGLIKDLISEGRIRDLKECIEKGRNIGMQSFEQHLLELFFAGAISEEVAMAEADSPANLRIAIKQYVSSKAQKPPTPTGPMADIKGPKTF